MDLRKFIPDSEDNALVALLILIGAVLAAKDFLGLLITDERAIYLLLALLISVIWRHAWRQYQTSRLADLPSVPKIFNPFRIIADSNPLRIWTRNIELHQLHSCLDKAIHAHVVVSGPSGAGKSTLVHDMLVPLLVKRKANVREFARYDGFAREMIESFGDSSDAILRQRALAAQYTKFVQENRCSIRDAFDPAYQSPEADTLSGEIVDYLEDALRDTGHKTVFIFDQIERLIHLLKADSAQLSTEFNGYEVYFFVAITKYLRTLENVRTVFVIRAEYLYQSFVLLEGGAAGTPATHPHLVHFLCPGINTVSSHEAVMEMREDFKKIPAVAPYAQRFEHINGLDSRAFSNTFLTQLFGFLVEHFYASDKRVADLLERGTDRTLALRYFFDYLLNEYAKQTRANDALDLLKVVIFTIAVENRIVGQPVTVERLAALAHIPVSSVEHAITFLRTSGLVCEETCEGRRAYRLVHDIISDYAIENEQFAVNSVLKDGVRGLSESCCHTNRLTHVENFADPLKDWAAQPNIGLVALWIFYLFGVAKVLYRPVCDSLFPLLSKVWAARDCAFVGDFYFGVYVMHVVWVTFIYFLDRGYMRYVLQGSIARFISKMMPVAGVVLGITLSQSPVLFLIPVISIGVVMSLLLLIGSVNGTFKGRVAQENRRWGLRTFFNMAIAGLIMPITAIALLQTQLSTAFWQDVSAAVASVTGGYVRFSAEDVPIVWMYLVNAVMIYFWWHISPEQRSRTSFAARLSVYDRARLEGDEQ